MEWAESGVVLPGLLQADRLADDLDNIGSVFDFLNYAHR
jgi:hypothetical protein